MKRIYELPQMRVVKLKNYSRLLVGSDPEQQGSEDDGNDGEGL